MSVDIVTIKKYRGPKAERVGAFVKQFVRNIAICSVRYCNMSIRELDQMYYALLSNERGAYSLMSAAMHRITPVHQSEMSIRRRFDLRRKGNQGRESVGSGRVDLWSYSNGVEYFLEFKRSYVALRSIESPTEQKTVSDSWSTLIKQIGEVRGGIAREEGYNGYESSTFFIGMQVITLRQSSIFWDKIQSKSNEQVAVAALRTWSEKLIPNADSVLVWNVTRNKHRIRPIDWDENDSANKWQIIPCHLFAFTISRN